jgi:hypothetical protein
LNNLWRNAETIAMFFVPLAFIGGIIEHNVTTAIFSPIIWYVIWRAIHNRNIRNGNISL